MKPADLQGQLWGAEARDWAELMEPPDRPLWEAMLDSATVSEGTQFLDVGCGGGGASILAARRGAHIAGLDAAEALIKVARDRLPEGDFRVGDMEEMPYSANTFDVTFASLVLMYAGSPVVALREMRRVTVSGGRVTVGIWGDPVDCEYRHILTAVTALLSTPSPSKGPFALSDAGLLEGIMGRVELNVLGTGEVDVPFAFADDDVMWRAVRSAGPIQSAMQRVAEDQVKAAVLRAAEPFRDHTGVILFRNRFRYVTAVR